MGLSQTSLAIKLSLTRDFINSLENKGSNPSFITLLKFREFFNVDLETLVFKDLSKSDYN